MHITASSCAFGNGLYQKIDILYNCLHIFDNILMVLRSKGQL